MTGPPPPLHRAPAELDTVEPRSGDIVTALVEAGLLGDEARDRAREVIDSVLADQRNRDAFVPTRRRLLEVAGYVGGGLVTSAGVLFAAMRWADLGRTGQLLLLGASAVVLGVAAALLVVNAGGPGALREPRHTSRRVLAGVLFTLAGGALAGVGGVAADANVDRSDVVAVIVGLVLVAAVGCAYYRVTAGVVSQVALLAGTLIAAIGVGGLLSASTSRSIPSSSLPSGCCGWLSRSRNCCGRRPPRGCSVRHASRRRPEPDR